MDAIRIDARDNVAVALRGLRAGDTVMGAVLLDDIAQGHKFALRDIAQGSRVIKYGCPIGGAVAHIPRGAHVHTHNLRTLIADADQYAYRPALRPQPRLNLPGFMGYRRGDGGTGIRNELWILPLVGCVNPIAQRIAAQNRHLATGGIGGVHAFSHPFGCSQTGDDMERTGRLLASLARNPNAGGVLVLGLGCETNAMDAFVRRLGGYDPQRFRFLICQDVPDEFEAAAKMLGELAETAQNDRRQLCPASDLVVGLKCGGSDGLSGITANPVVGGLCDMITAAGGSAILTEVTEMFGAEDVLLSRCADKSVFDKAVAMISGYKRYLTFHNQPVYENPTPGNKEGGITTLEDKSLGCTQKCGAAQVADVIRYGHRVAARGLSLLESPSNDIVSSTALAAAGAVMVLFTTGRGTPFGCPAPTLKIATNTALADKKPAWIDFDAGPVAAGEAAGSAAERLLDLVLGVAGGALCKNEINGCREIAIFHNGITM